MRKEVKDKKDEKTEADKYEEQVKSLVWSIFFLVF